MGPRQWAQVVIVSYFGFAVSVHPHLGLSVGSRLFLILKLCYHPDMRERCGLLRLRYRNYRAAGIGRLAAAIVAWRTRARERPRPAQRRCYCRAAGKV